MKRILNTFILSIMLSNISFAQPKWTSIGPDGGWADRVAFDPTNPNTVYGGGDAFGSFCTSTDGASTWQRSSLFGNINVWDVKVSPYNSNHIYVANIMNDSVGIIRSLDAGITLDSILTWPDIAVIEFHPTKMCQVSRLVTKYSARVRRE